MPVVPIRTPRGRAAAYRPLWQWPLRSPARLAATAVAVAVVATGAGVGVGALSGGPADGGMSAARGDDPITRTDASRSGTSATPRPTALAPVPELGPTPLPLSAAPAQALDVAARWSAAWVDHPPGITVEQWAARMRPLTTPEYFGQLDQVDPANVPASRVTGEPRAVRVASRSVQVDVPTDALTLRILVVDTATGWLVSGYDRA